MKARLTTTLAAVIAVAASCVIATGCGGGDESTTASAAGGTTIPSSISEAVAKEINAACRQDREDSLEKLEAYSWAARKEGIPKDVAVDRALKATVLSIFKADMAALSKLKGSAADARVIQAILDVEGQAFSKAKKQQQKASPEEIEAQFSAAEDMLRSYGLTVCTKSE